MKITRILTERQTRKLKFSLFMAVCLCIYIIANDLFVKGDSLVYNDETFMTTDTETFERGKIVYYSKNLEVCTR
jgi:hypothetical protein